ncbi:MAG TPA: DUF1345 domain-containing protein [Rhodocyclaceae bacterium]|nr:DUF1345 domain-containing protein [Rhodocyclaceae bacterium]
MKPHRTGTRRSPIARAWHQVLVRPRLVLSGLAGLLVFLLLPVELAISTRALMTWVVGAGLYLLLAFVLIWRASIEHMRWRTRIQDDGAAVVLFLTVAAAVASLVAIIMELAGLKSITPVRQALHLGLVGATFLASWLLVHTSFALHYAHAYYVSQGKEGAAPLEFPDQKMPSYMDFLYFSMVVGMTSQTADVAIATTQMRRLVMVHGMIAFAFNTILLALTINIAASLLG